MRGNAMLNQFSRSQLLVGPDGIESLLQSRVAVFGIGVSCRQHCICPSGTVRKCTERRGIPGSTAFVPSVEGLIIAGEVVKDLMKTRRTD